MCVCFCHRSSQIFPRDTTTLQWSGRPRERNSRCCRFSSRNTSQIAGIRRAANVVIIAEHFSSCCYRSSCCCWNYICCSRFSCLHTLERFSRFDHRTNALALSFLLSHQLDHPTANGTEHTRRPHLLTHSYDLTAGVGFSRRTSTRQATLHSTSHWNDCLLGAFGKYLKNIHFFTVCLTVLTLGVRVL